MFVSILVRDVCLNIKMTCCVWCIFVSYALFDAFFSYIYICVCVCVCKKKKKTKQKKPSNKLKTKSKKKKKKKRDGKFLFFKGTNATLTIHIGLAQLH